MVKVIIKRKVFPECIKQYEKCVAFLLASVRETPGFISSEILADAAAANIRYLLINFNNANNWQTWYKSDKRKAAVAEISSLLEEPEDIKILEFLSRS